jgi:hypothetical protein
MKGSYTVNLEIYAERYGSPVDYSTMDSAQYDIHPDSALPLDDDLDEPGQWYLVDDDSYVFVPQDARAHHAGLTYALIPIVGDDEVSEDRRGPDGSAEYRFSDLGARNKAFEMEADVATPFTFYENDDGEG